MSRWLTFMGWVLWCFMNTTFAQSPSPKNDSTVTGENTDNNTPKIAKIAIILPLQSPTLKQAAQEILAGFQAAYELNSDNIKLDIVSCTDDVEDVLTSYENVQRNNDVIVGPLSRASVLALLKKAKIEKPTLALNQIDPQEREIALPPFFLPIGLSVEEDARATAIWAAGTSLDDADSLNKKNAWVIVTSGTWQKRAAKAFSNQWEKLGGAAHLLEIKSGPKGLSEVSLLALPEQVSESDAIIFSTLNADQTQQIKAALGKNLNFFGTSQINSGKIAGNPLTHLLDTRFIDIPWVIALDHPAVMTFPRQLRKNDTPYDPNMDRLYALGIDAYRIASEISKGKRHFQIDGVTGDLSIELLPEKSRFIRNGQRAYFSKNGIQHLP